MDCGFCAENRFLVRPVYTEHERGKRREREYTKTDSFIQSENANTNEIQFARKTAQIASKANV